MSRKCPECNLPMTPFAFHSVALDECRQCGGIWFDDGELKRCQASGTDALSELEEEVRPEIMLLDQKDHGRNCPVCNLRLTTYRYLYTSEIMLDECESCYGVWVQEGELEKMAEFLEGGRPARIVRFCGVLSRRDAPFAGQCG